MKRARIWEDTVDAIVVGAGISGLSAAYSLQQAGFTVTVLERAADIGGVIRSERTAGYLLEHGPNSIQSSTPLLDRFIRELDLSPARVRASAAARVRYIVRNGRPVAAPVSPTALFTSSLFGASAKLRLMREPFVAAGDAHVDESVADFVRRRLGQEFLDYAMNPFVGGVYAGDPERLSVRHTFPSLVELEQKHGSIIKGQLEKRRDPTRITEAAGMFSFQEGIGQLMTALTGTLQDVKTNHIVDAVEKSRESWVVSASGQTFRGRAVICTAPLHHLDAITLPGAVAKELLSSVEYPPLSVVHHAYRREDVGHPLEGFGMLIPDVEREFHILGTLFSSSIFPNRAPDDEVLLTTFVGGTRRPELAALAPDEMHRLVQTDLSHLLGIDGEPTFMRHTFCPHAIPQYRLGYDAVVDALERLEIELPGWFMAGNYRGGVSVGDTAQSGHDTAERCMSFLRS